MSDWESEYQRHMGMPMERMTGLVWSNSSKSAATTTTRRSCVSRKKREDAASHGTNRYPTICGISLSSRYEGFASIRYCTQEMLQFFTTV